MENVIRTLFTIWFLLLAHWIEAQKGEYFVFNDSTHVSSMEINIIGTKDDSVTSNLYCEAIFSNSNRIDTITCYDEKRLVVSKFIRTYLENGFLDSTIYYNFEDTSEIYRIDSYVVGKHSILEFSNNKNNKGYKLTTLYDECCNEYEKHWYTNSTLVSKEIIENIYPNEYDCKEFCLRTIKKVYNPFNSLYLTSTMTVSSFDQSKVGRYNEESGGKFLYRLDGDTIVKIQTDSINYLSETRSVSNDSLNYLENNFTSLNGIGTNYKSISIDHKDFYIHEYYYNFYGQPIDNNANYSKGKRDLYGEVATNYRNDSDEDISGLKSSKINTFHKFDRGNWTYGEFDFGDGSKHLVTRTIKYK